MKKIKKIKKVAIAAVLCMAVPVLVQAATENPENGALYYCGAQTDDEVYSEIYDQLTPYKDTEGDGIAWAVKATVTVGSSTYTSGFRYGTAYKSAKRSFWSNEKSYYQYKKLNISDYTDAKWGQAY